RGEHCRVGMAGGGAGERPSAAGVEQTVTAPGRFEQQSDEGSFAPKMSRDVATSADGDPMGFHAVGKLWRKRLPGGQPERLTGNEGLYEYEPSFSPDGRQLLYTTWSDEALGALAVRSASGAGAGRRRTSGA